MFSQRVSLSQLSDFPFTLANFNKIKKNDLIDIIISYLECHISKRREANGLLLLVVTVIMFEKLLTLRKPSYKKDWNARQKIRKEPLRGIKINTALLVWLEIVSPLNVTRSKSMNYLN